MKKIVFSLLVLLFLSACSTSFNQSDWLEEPEKRNSMVHNLIQKNELVGMTENEVIDLLGEPEEKLDEPNRQFVYYMGRAGLGVDDSLFRIYFDKDGKLESHKILND